MEREASTTNRLSFWLSLCGGLLLIGASMGGLIFVPHGVGRTIWYSVMALAGLSGVIRAVAMRGASRSGSSRS